MSKGGGSGKEDEEEGGRGGFCNKTNQRSLIFGDFFFLSVNLVTKNKNKNKTK